MTYQENYKLHSIESKPNAKGKIYYICNDPEVLNAHPFTDSFTKTGDLTLDDTLDIADVIFLSRYVANDTTVSVSDHGIRNCDCNGDGIISMDDVTCMLRIIARLEP